MKKWHKLVFTLIALSFLATLFADAAAPAPAPVRSSYGIETVESLTGAGLIKLNGTTVQNNLHVDGSLIAQNAVIHSLEVLGEANFTHTTIDSAFIVGSLQATRSTFTQPLRVQSQKIVFTSSKLEGITVLKDGGYKGKQIIELRQGTIVNGPIRFESGKGEVVIYPGSQVLGSIDGGKAVKKH